MEKKNETLFNVRSLTRNRFPGFSGLCARRHPRSYGYTDA
jgi:hypothetical protein